jgi:hypothetical protein
MDETMKSGNLDEGFKQLMNASELKQKMQDAIAGNKIGVHEFTRADGKKYKLTFECKNGKMLGVIQPQ